MEGCDADDREYPENAGQIREVLIHGNYLSREDMRFCVAFDLSELERHPVFDGISSLQRSFCDPVL